MADPYRTTLPVVRDVTTAVCVWCKWHTVYSDYSGRHECTLGNTKRLDPLRGWRSQPNTPCVSRNADGECPHYRPSLFTRLAWWRRLP